MDTHFVAFASLGLTPQPFPFLLKYNSAEAVFTRIGALFKCRPPSFSRNSAPLDLSSFALQGESEEVRIIFGGLFNSLRKDGFKVVGAASGISTRTCKLHCLW